MLIFGLTYSLPTWVFIRNIIFPTQFGFSFRHSQVFRLLKPELLDNQGEDSALLFACIQKTVLLLLLHVACMLFDVICCLFVLLYLLSNEDKWHR